MFAVFDEVEEVRLDTAINFSIVEMKKNVPFELVKKDTCKGLIRIILLTNNVCLIMQILFNIIFRIFNKGTKNMK